MIRLEYLVLHEDLAFPLEAELSGFFMPSFWTGDDFRNFNSDFYYESEIPGHWNSLEMERTNADLDTEARFTLETFRESNEGRSALFTELPIQDVISQYRQGAFRAFPEVKNMKSFAVTSLILETEDSRFRKEMYQTLDRFLRHTGGVIVYPEAMNADEFRRFHSLATDVVEQETEPADEDQ